MPPVPGDPAPEIDATRWLNADVPFTLAGARGRPVVVLAFQMLCPGCAAHAVPQARRLHALVAGTDVAVIGLHCVFEHRDVTGEAALAAFLHEYGVRFPVGIDRQAPGAPLPATMSAYAMRGTPTTLVVDRAGRLAAHSFGAVDDLALGFLAGRLSQM